MYPTPSTHFNNVRRRDTYFQGKKENLNSQAKREQRTTTGKNIWLIIKQYEKS